MFSDPVIQRKLPIQLSGHHLCHWTDHFCCGLGHHHCSPPEREVCAQSKETFVHPTPLILPDIFSLLTDLLTVSTQWHRLSSVCKTARDRQGNFNAKLVLLYIYSTLLAFILIFLGGAKNHQKSYEGELELDLQINDIPKNRKHVEPDAGPCTAVTALLHYFLLATFVWNSIYGTQLVLLIRSLRSSLPPCWTRLSHVVGWGECVCVGGVISANHEKDKKKLACLILYTIWMILWINNVALRTTCCHHGDHTWGNLSSGHSSELQTGRVVSHSINESKHYLFCALYALSRHVRVPLRKINNRNATCKNHDRAKQESWVNLLFRLLLSVSVWSCSCWLAGVNKNNQFDFAKPLFWGFLLPVGLILVYNVVLLVITALTTCKIDPKLRRWMHKMKKKKKNEWNNQRQFKMRTFFYFGLILNPLTFLLIVLAAPRKPPWARSSWCASL